MNQRVPKLRRHARGQWFCHWGGKSHYFGTDHQAAQNKYLKTIADWTTWRTARNAQRLPPMSKAYTVADILGLFLKGKEREGGLDLRRYYEKHLRRFILVVGEARADMIRPAHLQALKDGMLDASKPKTPGDPRSQHVRAFADKTINHDLVAVKGMLMWAAGLEYIPAIALGGVKTLPLGPPPDRSLYPALVHALIKAAPQHLRAWLAINYLACMRPKEVVQVVGKQGEWVGEGVFRLDRGKMDKKARMARHICFSAEALTWLDRCRPVWSRLDSYSAAFRRVYGHAGWKTTFGPCGPHPLRHSGATHLLRLGVARADIDLILGHSPPRVSLIYAQIDWQPLRVLVARLTLESASVHPSAS